MKAVLLISVFSMLLFSCQPEKTAADSNVNQSIQKGVVKTIGAAEFKSLSTQANAVILDVRTPQEVTEGKIPNALVINIYDPEFQTKVLALSKDKSIFIYCSAGVRSAKAADFLINQGYESVYHLQGGLGDWYRNDFPFEK